MTYNEIDPYIAKITVEDMTFDFFINDEYGDKWYGNRTSSTHHELAFVRDMIIKRGDIVFDIGAQHIFHTIPYSQWVGSTGYIYAFEANPRNVYVAKKNLKINKIRNVKVINRALGAAKGKMFMRDFTNAYVLTGDGETRIKVKMVNLDSYLNLAPDFLKIDVEGYETEVLKGAKNILETRPKLAIEIHAQGNVHKRYNTSFDEILGLINIDRYDCWIQFDRQKPPERYNLDMYKKAKDMNDIFHFYAIPKS